MNNSDLIIASIKKRKKREKRFRFYGLISLLFAVFALVMLFASIAIPASNGFMQNYVKLDFPANIDAAKSNVAVKNALFQLFPEVSKFSEKRQLSMMLAPHAASFVPINSPAASALIPLSSNIDLWIKNPENVIIPPKQQQFITALKQRNLLVSKFNWEFFTSNDSRSPEKAGFYSAIIGSIYLVVICLIAALPIGIAAAVYLEEFAPKNRFTDIIEININNLAAVPSIIYGLLGLFIYLNIMSIPRSSALAGGLTLALMTLPIIIISTRIALKAVPSSIRNAALAIGASPLQVVAHHLLPQATGGIITGTILGMSRAIGETAPLLMIGMVAFIVNAPTSLLDPTTAMPVQIYIWASSPEIGFVHKTACGIIILISILLCFNFAANRIRSRAERKYS
jgi:phosphate transport system permease protein